MNATTHWSVRLTEATRSGVGYGAGLAVVALFITGKAVLFGGAPRVSLLVVPASFLLFGGVAFLLRYLGPDARHSDVVVSPWMAVILIGVAIAAYLPFLLKDLDSSLPFAPSRVAILAAASWTVVVVAFRVLWWVVENRRS